MPNWKKVIVSGSDAALNSLNVTNLLSVTGSSNLTGSLNISGSTSILGNTGTTTFYTNADTLIFTGSVYLSGSIYQTGSLNVTSVTSSLFGTSSWSRNAITSSYTVSALSASYALTASYALNGGGGGGGGDAFTYHQTSSAVTWSVTHNLSTYTPLVQVYDDSYNLITPSNISGSGLNTTQITFAYATTGYAVISTGGSVTIDINISGSNATLIQATPATTWSFYHGLNETYPVFTIFDSNDDVIVPLKIHADNANTASIYFSTARTGTAVAANCGLSGSTFESASWAATASYFAGTIASASYATTASYALTSNTSTLQQVVNTGNGISNYGGNGSASIQSTNFTNNRTLYLNDNSFPTIRLVDNLNASNNLQIDIATLSLNGTSYNWSDIVNSTSSYALTASYVNPLRQTVEITGSFNVTGSTTQIGNNTLLGNTTLSGSIIISGSTTPGNPTASVQIYGDIRQTGYHRFDPVTTNINTSISASYIFVSGSTQDLYFSQNSAGYSNVTRLRWLESNLYTGILNGGIITSTPGSTTWNISSGSGIIVTQNASTGSAPYPTVQFVTWGDLTNIPITNSGSAKLTYVGIDNTGTPVQQTVPWGSTDINQFDTQISLGVVLHLSGSVSTGVFSSPQISYGQPQKADDFFRAFGPLKISGHTLSPSGSSPTLSIIKTGGSAYKEGANYRFNANHPSTTVENDINVSKIYRYYISGSTPVIDTGIANAGYTEIDNKNYVDTTTGTLAAVGASNWSIQRVFWIPNSPTNAFLVYYGNARYGTLLNAVNAKDSELFTEAPNTAQNAIFLGYIIIQGGGTGTPPRNLNNSNETTIIPGGLFRSVGGVGSSGTSPTSTTLEGLADVSAASRTTGDLLYYNGSQWINSKSLTGNYNITGSLTATSLTGSLFGTASNAVSSSYSLSGSYTTLASTASYSSNSDLLDGLDSTSFVYTSSFNTFSSSYSTRVTNTEATASAYVTTSGSFSTRVTNLETASGSFSTRTTNLETASGSFSTRVTNAESSITSLNSKTGSYATTGSNAFSGNQTVTTGYVILTQVSQSLNYADDTAAAAGGVPLGGLYRNGNFIAIRIV
jgi:hypothetical protein